MPVLLQVFPQGLDAHDPELSSNLRAAHEEWADNQAGLTPDPAIHTAWVQYVLQQALEYNQEVLLEGQSIPTGLSVPIPEHAETLHPDLVLAEPDTHKPRLLIQIFPSNQALDKPPTGSRWQASTPRG